MKKTLIILTFLTLALFSCGDSTQEKNDAVTLEPEQVLEIEKENTEIETLELEINQDLEELDTLLNELDNI